MASIVNEITRNTLSELTKKELLQKVLAQKDIASDKDIKIKSPIFESTVKNVLINHYDLVDIPSQKLDKFVETFRQAVRRHHEHKKVSQNVNKILQYFPTYYEVKIEKNELQDKPKKRPRDLEAGTSRPPQTPMAKRIKSKAQRERDSKKVRENAPTKDSIGLAFVQSLRSDGHHSAAFVAQEIWKNPELGPKLKAFLKKENNPEKWRNIDVLANFFDQDMSVSDYNSLRENVNKTAGINAMPCYDILYKEKLKCCLEPDSIIQTEDNVQCSMQDLCKHDFFRLVQDLDINEKLEILIERYGAHNLKLIYYFKYGTDGSSGHIGKKTAFEMYNQFPLKSSY